MFWNHDLDPAHDHGLLDRHMAKTGRRLRHSVSAGVLALIVLSLAMPFSGVAAAGKSGRTLLAEWSAMSPVSVVQQSSGSIGYRGTWRTAYHAGYMDGKARATKARSAKASLRFTGSAIAWVGPVGPTRGKARIYIDGKLVTTVDARASRFRASRVLFTKSWSKVGTHRISIVANGTPGRPTVALDAFLVRRDAPAPATSVRVTSITGLLNALADNSTTEIVVANGTYRVSPASSQASNSLWIGARYASRTRAVTVRAETRGGVTFSGGGATGWVGLAFRDGVHHQTWQGFRFANAEPTSTGVIVFGQSGSVTPVPPHHITLLDITVEESITSDNPVGTVLDHAVYFSKAQAPGVHDILIDRLTVKAATSGLDSAIHFFHSAAGTPNANNVTIRHLNVTGTDQAVILWDPTLYDIVVEDSAITGASRYAVRYEEPGSGIVLRRVTSTGSALAGFYSSRGGNPPGVTFVDSSLR